jgi:hypothetical protein
MWDMHMDQLEKRKKQLWVKETIDNALWEYYSEKGLEVPNWKMNKNPQWWRDYLIDLGIDPQNP